MAEANRMMLQNVSKLPEEADATKREQLDVNKDLKKITVRSHTKVIYYVPTVLAAIFFGLQAPNGSSGWSSAFLSIFFLNTVVVLFDFNSLRTLFLTLVFSLIGLTIWHFGWVGFLSSSLAQVNPTMNSHAYFVYAAFFGMLILGDVIWSHLNRWEFSANEVKRIQAFAGHTANFPGRGLRFQVRTVDVFERLLLGAGTVLLLVGKRKIKLKNVIFAHRKVKQLEKFVRTTGVFADDDDVFEEDFDDDDDE